MKFAQLRNAAVKLAAVSTIAISLAGLSALDGAALPVLYSWNPELAETLPATSTFTRASISQVLTTTDGSTSWYQEAKSGELRLDGLRRVENLLDSSNGTGPFSNITKDGRLAVSVIASNGTLTINIGGTPQVFTPTGTPQRFVAFDDATGGSTSVTISGTATLSEPMAHLCQVGNDIPEPYVAHDQEFGNVGVNGVRNFNTANTSSVDGNGVVTEATGTTITGGGYLPEPAATNICIESSDYNTSWTLDNLTATNDGVSDLGLVQHTLDAGTNNTSHSMFIIPGGASGGSVYVLAEQGTGRYLTVRRGNDNANDYACFDLQTGTITEEGFGIDDAIITLVGGGIYKCEVNTSDTSPVLRIGISNTATPGTTIPVFTGANETIIIHHVQAENTTFSTSPIITSGSTVTRVADNLSASVTTTGAYSWFADLTGPSVIPSNVQIMADQASGGAFNPNTSFVRYQSGGLLVTCTGVTILDNRYKAAANVEEDNGIVAATGGTTGTDTSGAITNLTTLYVGSRSADRQYRGRIHNFVLYNASQTQSQLEALVA